MRVASWAIFAQNSDTLSLRPRGYMFFRSIDQVRRFFKILGGFTLLLVGVIMVFTPGPGWPVIFLGLTLLAAEFVWAKKLMDRMKHEGNRLKDTVLKFGKTDSA
jgi:uncharacterized protein (TIGR02611 family)